MAEDIILQVSHLGKSFCSQEVLKDIHFDVKKGCLLYTARCV